MKMIMKMRNAKSLCWSSSDECSYGVSYIDRSRWVSHRDASYIYTPQIAYYSLSFNNINSQFSDGLRCILPDDFNERRIP